MPLRLAALFVVLVPLAVPPAVAQERADVEALSRDLRADQAAHLRRVGVWGLANAVGGAALWLAADRDRRPGPRAFGLQSAAWGTINTGIAAFGLAGGPGPVTGEWAAALAAENGYADVLLVNLGLNVGYAAVGTTLWLVAGRGVSDPDAWRGHGAALVVQGLGLFVLDTVAYVGTRARLGALVDLAGRAALAPTADGLALVVAL
jgi:hypothetical protein